MMQFTLSELHERAKNRPSGYVDEVLSCSTVHGDLVEMSKRHFTRIRSKYQDKTAPQTTHPDGAVGTELKKLLTKIGITATPNCSCNKRAKVMDAKGPDWCAENIETITGWLREEATKRNLPFIDTAGKALIKLAVYRARRNKKKTL